jgi:hypothetical protein
MNRKDSTKRDLNDQAEAHRLRTFSSLGIRPPKTKKEKYKFEAMLKRIRKSC